MSNSNQAMSMLSMFSGGSNPMDIPMSVAAEAYNWYKIREQRRYNESQVDKQWQRMLDQWNRENTYNDPRQVIARMKDAHVNPALAFMNGASFAPAASSPSPGANKGQPVPIDPMTAANIDLARSQSEKNRAEADVMQQKLPQEIQNLRYVGEHIQEMMNSLVQERKESQSRIFLNQEQQSYYLYQSEKLKQEVRFFKDTYDDMKSQVSSVSSIKQKELDAFDEQFETMMDLYRRQGLYYLEHSKKALEDASILSKVNQHWYTLENNKVALQNSEIRKNKAERQRLYNDIVIARKQQNLAAVKMATDAYFQFVDKQIQMVNALGEVIPF